MHISDKGASTLASVGFFCFLAGRFSGAAILKKFSAHKVLGTYGLINVLVCLTVFLKLGWISVAGVFLSYFFMSIMFPTIFALGIHGLGARAKKASSFIVMAIMGGAIIAQADGVSGRQVRYVARLYRPDGLFRICSLLRLPVAAGSAKPSRLVACRFPPVIKSRGRSGGLGSIRGFAALRTLTPRPAGHRPISSTIPAGRWMPGITRRTAAARSD